MIQHQCVCGELYYPPAYWQHADCKAKEPADTAHAPIVGTLTLPANSPGGFLKVLVKPEPANSPKKRGRPVKHGKAI